VAGNENNQRVLNIGSIVYPRSLLSEAKMVNIKICFSQDRDFDNDFYLLIMFKFSGFPVGFYSMVNGTITYLYGSCKYFIFGEGKSSNTPELYITQAFENRNVSGVDTECAIFTFYFRYGNFRNSRESGDCL
jgi:hypothetical protein